MSEVVLFIFYSKYFGNPVMSNMAVPEKCTRLITKLKEFQFYLCPLRMPHYSIGATSGKYVHNVNSLLTRLIPEDLVNN